MPVVVALEELVGGGAEAVPDFVGLVAADGADRLPLGLPALHLAGGGIPLHRLGEDLGALAERFLLRHVLGPRLLAGGQILAAAREERVRGGAESLAELADGVARRRAQVLPRLLQLLESRGGAAP